MQGARRWRETFYFYSRPCGRGDVEDGVFLTLTNQISTHAPAGGATAANGTERIAIF